MSKPRSPFQRDFHRRQSTLTSPTAGRSAVATKTRSSDHQLAVAVGMHRAGRLDEAERIYQEVIDADPNNANAWQLFGLVRHQQGQNEKALEMLHRAIALAPTSGNPHVALGQVHAQLGDAQVALAEFAEAARIEPTRADFLNTYGEQLLNLNRDDEAAEAFRQALQHDPDFTEARNNLGNALWKLGRYDEATQCYRNVLSLRPNWASVHASLGSVLNLLEQPDAAVRSLQRAVELQPDYAEAHNNLGNALRDSGRYEPAIKHLTRAVELQPKNAVFHDNLGLAFKAQQRWNEAIQSFRQAFALQPTLVTVMVHLGLALKENRQTDEAMSILEMALDYDPTNVAALNGVACSLFDKRQFRVARAVYERVLAIEPNNTSILENLASCACEQGDANQAALFCDQAHALSPQPKFAVKKALRMPPIFQSTAELLQRRSEITHDLDQLLGQGCRLTDAVRDIGSASFYFAYHGVNERPMLSHLGQFYSTVDPSLNFVAPHCQQPWSHPRGSRKLRVGFLSRFFCNHSLGLHYGKLVSELSHEELEITLLRVTTPNDAVAQEIRQHVDNVLDLPADIHHVREKIASRELDVLIYTDIGMDFFTYFLAFSRLAPIQCSMAGHPMTTGIPTVDYYLSCDDMEPEDAQEHYSERLIRFQNLMTRFARPELPATPKRREDFGFTREQNLYLCPQTLFKLHPDYDLYLAEILRRDPQGVIALFHADSPDWSDLIKQRLQQVMPDVVERIVWRERMSLTDFYSLVADSDVMLDTIHFNGATTSMQGLAFGTPIITQPGEFMRGRTTLLCYRKMQMFDLVANSREQYVELAIRAATDKAWQSDLRKQILAKNEVLFENNSVARELEDFLRQCDPLFE